MPDETTIQLIIDAIKKTLSARYEFIQHLDDGATGCVLSIREKSLDNVRAIKVLRPDLPAIDTVSLNRTFRDYFAREINSLAAITHENIVAIYEKGDLVLSDGRSAPYYIMEFVEGHALDEHISLLPDSDLTARHVFLLFSQILSGLAAVHASGIVHGDIKPANIRVKNDGTIKLMDFGFAKVLAATASENTLWCQDRRYLHPELRKIMDSIKIPQPTDEARSIIPVSTWLMQTRGKIWELHSLGVTLNHAFILANDKARDLGIGKLFEARDDGFIRTMIDRLVDRRDEGPWDSTPRTDTYTDAGAVKQDIAKLLDRSDISAGIPELSSGYHHVIRVPLIDPIPLTPRLKAIIDHPLFQRLGCVTQLGVSNLVFRSANHTRFEHSLGVLATCIQYLKALWWSATASYFRQIVRKEDLEAVMLASLLHDLGQYPFAHAFEESEIADRQVYSHSDLTRRLISARNADDLEGDTDTLFDSPADRQRIERLLRDRDNRLLADIIRDEWDADISDILYLLGDETKAAPRPVLRLLRDIVVGSLDADKMDYLRRDALHLGIPGGPDLHELLSILTIVPTNYTRDAYALAIEPSGVSVAQDVHMSRYRMFLQVYWNPVGRSAERMLRFAVDTLREHHNSDGSFKRMFFAKILTVSDAQLISELRQYSSAAAQQSGPEQMAILKDIAAVLEDLEQRRLYDEVFLVDAGESNDLHNQLSCFWSHALRDREANDAFKRFSKNLIGLLGAKTGLSLRAHQVLLDIPDPTTDHPRKYAVRVRNLDGTPEDIEEVSPIWGQFSELFRLHARKIRVFAPPAMAAALKRVQFDEVFSTALADAPKQFLRATR